MSVEPMPRAYKPLKEIRSVEEAVVHPDVVTRFQNALGDGFDAKQYLTTIRNLLNDNDLFKRADVWELMRCALELAELGLRPNTPFGHAWIIPRVAGRGTAEEKVTLDPQVGYQGYLELAYRSDALESIQAEVVYEGDVFECEYGTNAHLRHKPVGARKGRTPTHVYAFAKLTNGGQAFVSWAYEDVLAIRDESEAYKSALKLKAKMPWVYESSPWVKWIDSMLRKTMILQLLKYIPKSSERLTRASYIDGLGASGKISFEGKPGDLESRYREISYSPSTTLNDLGMKQTVNGDAQTVSTQETQKQPDAPKPQTSKPTSTARATRASGEGWEAGPPAGMFDDDEPQNTRQESSAGGGLKVKDQIVILKLIDADGVIIAEDTETPWAEMYVEHMSDVPPDLLDAFREHNEEALIAAFAHPPSAHVLREAGIEPPTIDGKLGDREIEGEKQAPAAGDLVVKPLDGRMRDHEIVAHWEAALGQVGASQMEAWKAANKAGIASLHARLKLSVFKAIANRCRALGIEVPQ